MSMKRKNRAFTKLALATSLACASFAVIAEDGVPGVPFGCADLPAHAQLAGALKSVVTNDNNGGIGLNMWATVVNRDGIVCGVAFSGHDRGDQWPGSRVISAQKANTANAFSLPGLALSTANLYSAVQPGGTLYGLQHSNPVDTEVAYGGEAADFGQSDDPVVGHRLGGVNGFGGGLALYARIGGQKGLVGAIGVPGDSSLAHHHHSVL